MLTKPHRRGVITRVISIHMYMKLGMAQRVKFISGWETLILYIILFICLSAAHGGSLFIIPSLDKNTLG